MILCLNEKIQWLKLYDRTSLHTKCADKYAVRDYVRSKNLEQILIPLLFYTEDVNNIAFNILPEPPFIIKTTHASADGIIVKDKTKIDWKAARQELRHLLKMNYYFQKREWAYKNIQPRIVVEKLLLDRHGNIPYDFKIHCFHGVPKIIQVDMDRFFNHKRNFYDTQWNLLNFTWCPVLNGSPVWPKGRNIRPPQQLKDMLQIAKILSSEFLYARIDLYNFEDKIYFGEITFYHGCGMEIFKPAIWDKKIGDMLTLPRPLL